MNRSLSFRPLLVSRTNTLLNPSTERFITELTGEATNVQEKAQKAQIHHTLKTDPVKKII